MYMIHYYLQKGFVLDYLLELSAIEKMFLSKSMEIAIEEENVKYQALFGEGK